MTDHDPDAVLLAMPRRAWDVLAATPDRTVRAALDELVQVDRLVHVAVRTLDGTVDAAVVSVHMDAAESVAQEWSADSDHGQVTVLSVPVGLDRATEVVT